MARHSINTAIGQLRPIRDNRWWMYEYNMFYEDDGTAPEWWYGFFKVTYRTPEPDWEDWPLPLWFDIA